MTILGLHTAHELADLLRSYDYQLAELAGAQAAAADAWTAADPVSHQQWVIDYGHFLAAWAPVSERVHATVNGTPSFLTDTLTEESDYQAAAAAFLPLADLDRRMRAAPRSVAALAPSYADNPQPNAPDADLGAYVAVDAGIRAMPAPVRAIADRIAAAGGVGRGTADAPPPGAPWLTPVQEIALAVVGLGALALIIKLAK